MDRSLDRLSVWIVWTILEVQFIGLLDSLSSRLDTIVDRQSGQLIGCEQQDHFENNTRPYTKPTHQLGAAPEAITS